MALHAHIAFAKNREGELVSARELFELQPGSFTCLGCGGSLLLRFARKGLTYFSHGDRPDCPLGAQHALRAAALLLLESTRCIQTPSLKALAKQRRNTKTSNPRTVTEAWDTGSSNIIVEGVTVDFLAETLAGRLGIQVSLPGLTDPGKRERLRELGFPVLEVALAKPTAILTFADLRVAVIDGCENKRWLAHPALELGLTPLEQQLGWELEPVPLDAPPAARARLSVPVTPAAQKAQRTNIAESAIYRQLPVVRKIESLEKRTGLPQARWPDSADVWVRGGHAFGCDHQLWQFDVFDKFVCSAAQRQQTRFFSSQHVFVWLSHRYDIEPPFPNAEKVAIYDYLESLAQKGFLRRLKAQKYEVITAVSTRPDSRPEWVPFASLSVSTLVTVSRQCGLHFPLEEVERILACFDDSHPAEDVENFVSALATRLHAPPRSVLEFLREARLVIPENSGPSDLGEPPGQSTMF